MSRRQKPARPPSRLLRAILALAIVAIGFATLMVRLEFTEEGYRLSALQKEISEQNENGRRLRLEAAELSAHQRLRALAAKYHLEAPRRGQVVMAP
jgi:cell division protein FtsL